MKKILFIFAMMALSMGAFAQLQWAEYKSVTMDTLLAVETNTSQTIEVTSEGTLVIQVYCTDIGGTPDGYVYVDVSADGTNFVNLQSATGLMYAYPNDTLTISAGAIGTWVIEDSPWQFYRTRGLGTANDSTLIVTRYNIKK